jgi:hypothetical protein
MDKRGRLNLGFMDENGVQWWFGYIVLVERTQSAMSTKQEASTTSSKGFEELFLNHPEACYSSAAIGPG